MPFSATRDLWLVLKARDEGSRAMRSFSRDIRMVGDSVRQANLQAARSALQNQMAMQRLTGASQADIIATQNRIAQVDRDIHSMRTARAAMEENRVSAQRLSSTLTGAAATMTALGTGMLIAGGFGVAGLKGLIDSAIDYQKQSSLTVTQVDKFSASLRQVEDIGLRIANKIGVSFQDIQPALFDIFSSMEVGTKDAESLLATFSKAAVAGQTSIQSASRATIGILNAFQLPISSVNHLMDVQFQLVKEGIGTYEEWTQRIGLVTPSAVRAGQSVEMMAAALAATTRMGISAARSGTAVARAMDAMSNPTAVANMKELGVNALDASGHFRPMVDILTDFRTALQKVPEAKKIETILNVFKGAGGTIEARRFLQNMLLTPGNLELFKNIFETMSKESGSFEQAYSIMADTAATKSQLLANKWQILKINAGEALIPTFLKIVDALGKVFDWFNKLDPRTQRLITLGTGLSLVLITLGGILFLILGTIAAFAAAVAVAGSALFVVLGVITGVTAAFALLTAAIALAWYKSENFRGIFNDLSKQIRDFHKNYLIPTAIAVRDAWLKYMQPAFNALLTVVETKVMPVFRALHNFISGEFFKSIMEVGNNVKDVLVFAFKYLADVINKMVIPVLNQLVKFYHEHEETIKQLIKWVAFLGKWLLKIALVFGGILAMVLIGPVIGAFLAVIGVIIAVIAIIVFLVEAGKSIIKWFGTEIPKAWNYLVRVAKSTWGAISDFFVGIWNGIVSFFSGVWSSIISVWNSFSELFATGWNIFWNGPIGGLIKAIWGLIVAVINLALTSILFTIEVVLKTISDAWSTTWGVIKDAAIAVWNFIFPYLKDIWDAIVKAATTTWNAITSAITTTWNTVKDAATSAWNFLFPYLKNIWNAISVAATTTWNAIKTALSTIWNSIKDIFTGIWDKIKSFFIDLGTSMFDAGKNIIQKLIDGMTGKVKDVTKTIEDITKKIRDHLPFSPAKIGPLSGKGSPFIAGQKIGKMIADGMASKMELINGASNLMASASGVRVPNLINSMDSGGRTYNQSITINTSEMNPRRQAAELGWLLAGR
jgi:TP901 family phage tail tape measure protein